MSVLRLVVRVADLTTPTDPEHTETRTCADCAEPVWYRQRDSIPALGPEVIVCVQCAELRFG